MHFRRFQPIANLDYLKHGAVMGAMKLRKTYMYVFDVIQTEHPDSVFHRSVIDFFVSLLVFCVKMFCHLRGQDTFLFIFNEIYRFLIVSNPIAKIKGNGDY